MMQRLGIMLCGVLLAGCNESTTENVQSGPEVLVEVLFCTSSPRLTMHPATASVVAVTPGLGFPPSGRVAVAFKTDGEVLATGTGRIHMQQAAYSQPSNYEVASVSKANVSAGRKLTDVEECVVTGYWDTNGEPVPFEERAGIVILGNSLLDEALLPGR